MKRDKLISWLRVLSVCLSAVSVIWWAKGGSSEPRWLFFLSVLLPVIVDVVFKRVYHRWEQPAAEYEDLGRTPATYEQAARDREQKRFRLGAYRTTIRTPLSEQVFLDRVEHNAARAGFRPPEVQAQEDGGPVICLRGLSLVDSIRTRTKNVPRMELDLSQLEDQGKVDICAWAVAAEWIMPLFLCTVILIFEAIVIWEKAPFFVHLLLLVMAALAALMMPLSLRFEGKRALQDLLTDWDAHEKTETEDEP